MLRFIIVAFAAAAMAEVTQNGLCPDIKPMENFVMKNYQGMWYKIEKFPDPQDIVGKCATAVYKLEGDVMKVTNTYVSNGVQVVTEGIAKFKEILIATLDFFYNFGDVTKNSPVSIIDTDYISYSIVYSCKYDANTNTHVDTLLVLSRGKTLTDAGKNAVEKLFKDYKELDPARLVLTDFSDAACKFTSTSVITEPSK